jgi:serine phosphatase RsbU (regulator of sigma subunit)/ligand-binding sensor domain-containing protein
MKRWLILFLFLLIVGENIAQHVGLYAIQNYNQKNYFAGIQNFAVAQDEAGKLYFGNQSGLLIYNGLNWEFIETSNNSAVKSIAVSNKNQVFIGGSGDFGYLSVNSQGKFLYKSLIDLLPENELTFKDVWKTYTIDSLVFFQTFEHLFVYNGRTIQIISPENSFHLGFVCNNTFYINEKGVGLKHYQNGKLLPVSGGEFYHNKRIYALLENPSGLLVATRENGLFLLADGHNLPFSNDANLYLIENAVYHGVKHKNYYIYATLNGGVVMIDETGKLKSLINVESGLIDQNIKYVFVDNHQNLWLALNNGISKVNAFSPFSFFNDKLGLNGAVRKVIKYNEHIIAATSQGLFIKKLDAPDFKMIFDKPCWDLHFHKSSNLLLFASTEGLFSLNESLNINTINNEYVFVIEPSKKDSNAIHLGLYNGYQFLKFENKSWLDKGLSRDISETIRSIHEDNKGDVWMGVPYLGVIKWSGNKKLIYDTLKGFKDILYNVVFKDENNVLVGTRSGLYKYHPSDDIFIYENTYGNHFTDEKRQVFCWEKDDEKHWFYAPGKQFGNLGYFENNQIYTTPFEIIGSVEISGIYPTKNDVLFSSAEGLFVFDKKIEIPNNENFRAIINKVGFGKDSVLFYGNHQHLVINQQDSFYVAGNIQISNNIPVLAYKNNRVSFEFSATFFDLETQNEFSWFLDGNDFSWSDWKKENKTHYTNLHEGTYTLKVKARNVYGTESNLASYTFEILAPWYRTWWAYLLYFILFVISVYFIVVISTLRIKRAKILLEEIVKERTKEIQEQKEEIELQKHLVEEKNVEIIDSINYAKGIQGSILPNEEKIKQYLPSSFVLFKPKDIVSGDFYWMEAVDFDAVQSAVYFAAADCTGHGVPGAFVSMVGSNGLHRAVNEYAIYSPAAILDKLTQLVEDTFAKRKDGMDIAVVKICKTNDNQIIGEFAAANNPMWLVRKKNEFIVNNEPIEPSVEEDGYYLFEIKANKQPVGLFDARVPFTNNILQLEKGDKIYVSSDGFPDQFGGEKGKKFMSKNLKKILLDIYDKPMEEQKEILNTTFENWLISGNTEQIDDVCIFGVEVI